MGFLSNLCELVSMSVLREAAQTNDEPTRGDDQGEAGHCTNHVNNCLAK